MIEDVRIESEDDGFHLILDGDLVDAVERYIANPYEAKIEFRLSQSAALALRRAVREQIDPWWAEAEAVRLEMEQEINRRAHVREPIPGTNLIAMGPRIARGGARARAGRSGAPDVS